MGNNPGLHNRTVGERLKTLRTDKGWTLEDVARKIRSHKGYVSGIENGKVNPPSAKIMKRYCRIFGLDDAKTRFMIKLAAAQKAPSIIREEMIDLVLNHNGHCALKDFAPKSAETAPGPKPEPGTRGDQVGKLGNASVVIPV